MEVRVQTVHFTADKKLESFVKEKVSKLNMFYDNIVDGNVTLKLDKKSERDNKISEVKITIPGKELFAKKQSKSFEEATDNAIEALRKQLQKHKGKISAI